MKIVSLFFASFALIIVSFFILNTSRQKGTSIVLKNPVSEKKVSQKKLPRMVGFLPYWSVSSKVPIYSNYFTDIMYFGLTVDSSGELIKSGPEWNSLSSSYFKNIYKNRDKEKTNFSLIVKQLDGKVINKFVSDKDASSRLSSDILELIENFNFNGVNFDFEVSGTQMLDRDKLSDFLSTVTSNLRKKIPGLIISFDLSGQIIEKEKSYDIEKIGKVMDFVIIMGYDYKSQNAPFAGPVSPLYGEVNEHTISEAVGFVSRKIPSQKIILGIPLYGYEWETKDSVFKSSTTEKSGSFASIKRIETILEGNKNIGVLWDEKSQTPWFAFENDRGMHQIYYENEKSLRKKLIFAKDKNLFGVAFWALGYEGDDEEFWKELLRN